MISAALIRGYPAGEAVRQGCVPIWEVIRLLTVIRLSMARPITSENHRLCMPILMARDLLYSLYVTIIRNKNIEQLFLMNFFI